jgi:glycine/D-amino acid oxidase-like deaminating enzyme
MATKTAHSKYDIVIVGAGISGLYVARELAKKNPKASITILEKYKSIGGRTVSYNKDGLHWEIGAGRIRKSHKLTMNLIKTYGLTWIPIGDETEYVDKERVRNIFNELFIPMYIEPLKQLSPDHLSNHTIKQLLEKVVGKAKTAKILGYFPYSAEVNTLRADLALNAFDNEMGSGTGYGIIKEGFSELVKRMRKELEESGVTFLTNHTLVDIQEKTLVVDSEKSQIKIHANTCILALDRDAVAKLPAFSKWKTLDYLKMKPLLRTYAVFDTPWFSGMKTVVTPHRPRHIIPISDKVIMISYTDGDDTTAYRKILKLGEKKLEKAILSDVRRLFPDMEIPDPVLFKAHLWDPGCTYWLPGSYDPKEESKKACHPLPDVWLCGESWSMKQAWVEGALEHAETLLSLF